MEKEAFQKMFTELIEDLSVLKGRRTELETELTDVNKQIEQIDKVTDYLAPLCGYANFGGSLGGLGITDAVRAVLDPKERLSVADIKKKMEGQGYDFSSYSAPSASIHSVLKRLKDAGHAEVEKDGWNVFYKEPATAADSEEIKDEDIPF